LDYEGSILRHPQSKYKFGRYTLKSWDAYKLKPYETFDWEIIWVVQATVVDPTVEKTTNELGRSVTSKKKWDRIFIEKASCFLVKYWELEVKVVLSMTNKEKEDVRNNRYSYIWQWIEYKGMLIWAVDLPRHPVFIRFRTDISK
jgi:DNA ligase-1